MFRFTPSAISACSKRAYSTPPKSTVQLVGELRKLTQAPLSLARRALAETNNDLEAAQAWLEKDLQASGLSKAAKLKDRVATEGCISVSVLPNSDLGIRAAAIIELSCETDFVGRTEQFSRVARDIAHTAATFSAQHKGSVDTFSSLNVDELLEADLAASDNSGGSGTVKSTIMDLIARTGENITLRRAKTVSPSIEQGSGIATVGSYIHNPLPGFSSQGRIAGLALMRLRAAGQSFPADEAFRADLPKLERALARQIVGFNAVALRPTSGVQSEEVLYEQPFYTSPFSAEFPDMTVSEALLAWQKKWGLEEVTVADFVKWEVGGELS